MLLSKPSSEWGKWLKGLTIQLILIIAISKFLIFLFSSFSSQRSTTVTIISVLLAFELCQTVIMPTASCKSFTKFMLFMVDFIVEIGLFIGISYLLSIFFNNTGLDNTIILAYIISIFLYKLIILPFVLKNRANKPNY